MTGIDFSDFVRHPVTLFAGAFSTATALLQVEFLRVVGWFLWGNLGELFTVASLAGFTVAPNITFVPENPLIVLAVLTGMVYLVKKVYEMGQELNNQLES
jgi:hypothetical protein